MNRTTPVDVADRLDFRIFEDPDVRDFVRAYIDDAADEFAIRELNFRRRISSNRE